MLLVTGITGCKKEAAPGSQPGELTVTDEATALQRGIPHVVVHNGSSIQAAVNAAPAGTIIFIQPGIYNEAVVVNKAGIQLIGVNQSPKKEVIIQNPGDEDNGITSNPNYNIQ